MLRYEEKGTNNDKTLLFIIIITKITIIFHQITMCAPYSAQINICLQSN